MKKWIIRVLLLLGYCVPYTFLAMYGDIEYRTILFYGIMVVSFAGLCLIANKTNNCIIVSIGSVVSAFSSYYMMLSCQTEDWAWYFKPFTATQLLVIVSIITLSIQLLAVGYYKRRKNYCIR